MKSLEKLLRLSVWGLILPLIVLNGWLILVVFQYFQSLITVLVTAILLAFVLDYPVLLLRRLGVPRTRAIALVVLMTVAVLVLLGLTIIPAAISQVNEFATRLPSWIDSSREQINALQAWAIAHRFPINLSGLTDRLTERLVNQIQYLSGQVLTFMLDAASRALDFLLTFVLTFYLLLQGDRLWDGLFEFFPPHLSFQIRNSLRQNFHNYFIGQATLAALIGLALTVAFLIIQVPFGLLFGLGVGIAALFPFGAVLGIFVVSFLVALKSFWLGVRTLIFAIIIEQAIENGVAPRLLGGLTGLNPVWVLVSLLVGFKIAGLLGLVLAVPLASCIKIMVENFRNPPLD